MTAFVSGCGESGPATYHVAGKVTYQGSPLPTGNVMFVPDVGPAIATAIGNDGSYTLRAVAGEHRIVVTAVPPPPESVDESNYQPLQPLIPAKFGRAETSGVTVNVEPIDRNDIDIALD